MTTGRSESKQLPKVVADGPLDPVVSGLLAGKVELFTWEVGLNGTTEEIAGVYTYGHPIVNGAMMDRLPGLRIISNYGVGVDHIDVDEAAKRGIKVGNTPGVLEATTADIGFALLLAVARKLVEGDRYARSPEFTHYDPGYMLGREVHHATLGIIGLGNIGLHVARRALAFDMTVLYHNRRPRPEIEKQYSVHYKSLESLLAQSDYVILTCPLTESTRGLINARTIALMKPSAILVNIARGAVVDTSALLDALERRSIAGAAVDVTDPEPLPRDHGLLRLENIVITPHLGSATIETRSKMAELSVANLLAGIRKDLLLHEVRSAVV